MIKKSIIVLTVMASVVYWRWFFTADIFSYGDWIYFQKETMLDWFSPPSIWTTQTSLGFPDLGLSGWPYLFLYGWFATLGLDAAQAGRIIFLLPSVLMSVLGSFFLAKHFFKSNLAAICASFIFTFNTYSIIGRTGHLTLMTSFAFTPLALLFFIKTLESRSIKNGVIAGVLFLASSFFDFRGFYIFAWICLLYFLWFVFYEKRLSPIQLISTTFWASIPVVITLVGSLYWVFGFTTLSLLSENSLFSRGLFGNRFMNILESMTLFHPFWTGGQIAVFVVQAIPLYFFLIPLLVSVGIWINRNNSKVLFFGLVSLLGVFLAKQSGRPFPDVYGWLYYHFPGFNAYRESSKFYYLLTLGFSISIASLVDWIFNKRAKDGLTKYRWVFFSCISLLFLINTKPIITGELGTLHVPRHVPDDYLILNSFLSSDSDYYRTLWIPISSRWGLYSNSRPKIDYLSLAYSTWLNLDNTVPHKPESDKELQLLRVLSQPYADNLLDLSSIRYVILPLEDMDNDDNFFLHYGKRDKFKAILDGLPYLNKIDAGTREIEIYENQNWFPHFFISEERPSINDRRSYEPILSKMISPTYYEIELKELRHPVILNFSEAYNPGWELTLNGEYFESEHIQNNAKLNSFSVDPSKFSCVGGCTKNSDGSANVVIQVKFKPQSVVDSLFPVSLIALLASLMFLIGSIFSFIFKMVYHPRQ